MAKRDTSLTEEKIAQYYKKGRGSGELANYKPWLIIQDVPSSGRVHRIKGWKTSRIHHLLSDLERNYFLFLEWSDNVIDIREQYPLNREETLQIAEQMNVEHPVDPTSKTPIVMTTDFLVTLRENNKIVYMAKTIKPSEELEKDDVKRKFGIEENFWLSKSISWGIVTERDLPKDMIKNLLWLRSAYKIDETDLIMADELYLYLLNKTGPILEALNNFDELCNLEDGASLRLFKYLVVNKRIRFDIGRKFKLSDSISSLVFIDEKVEQKRVRI